MILNKILTKKNIILILILVIIVLAIVLLQNTRVSPTIVNTDQGSGILKEGRYPKAPELNAISGYLNTNSDLTIESLKGKVVLIDF
ncbi:MAG: hypothetical protein CMH62_03300 [Nanoarchaeota archaeon]|nr:hypothetical protein [Nanoarchaeota archaeon]|tara:strand:+ start:2298 stop:2555 length:258 start_codon:yes stop_codon:yes gene_type:complete